MRAPDRTLEQGERILHRRAAGAARAGTVGNAVGVHAVTDRQWLARTLRFPDRLDLVDEIHVTLAVRLARIDPTAERADVMALLDRNAPLAALCRDQRTGRVSFLA